MTHLVTHGPTQLTRIFDRVFLWPPDGFAKEICVLSKLFEPLISLLALYGLANQPARTRRSAVHISHATPRRLN